MRFAIALKITSCSFIIRSFAASACIVWLGSTLSASTLRPSKADRSLAN
jgi:hypothetical protein